MKKKIARRIEKGEKGGNSLNDEEKEKKVDNGCEIFIVGSIKLGSYQVLLL